MLKVLVVDDDAALRLTVKEALKVTGRFDIDEAVDGAEAVEKVRNGNFQIIVLDVDLPKINGLEALKTIKEHDPSIIVTILTAHANVDDAVKAVKEGAYNYVSKPVMSEDLIKMIDSAIEATNLTTYVANSAPVMMEKGRKIIGNNAEMQKVFNIVYKLAKVDTPVLIRGASGTGKELVARAIHFNSARKSGKFVAINCSAIPESLFESELFGHEKGAFTGADSRKIGKFQYAESGTLFLDELGDMPLLMQAKLLRVLQEKLFTPVGSNREIESNVRIIAATNKPLEEMIQKGEFREDLFYRLNVIPIFLPSLAERKDDLPKLISMFVNKFNDAHGKKILGLSPDTLACLKKYDWPGNIRELENVIEHSFILETSNSLNIGSLPSYILAATNTNVTPLLEKDSELTRSFEQSAEDSGVLNVGGHSDTDSSSDSESIVDIKGEELDFNKHKEAFEREFIVKALQTFKGRINQTALHAKIPKKTLLRKIEKYGINARDYVE